MALYEFTPEERVAFASSLTRNPENGCLEWNRGKTGKGYGAFRYRGRTLGAHRIAFMMFKGEIPNGLLVCHKCNNRLCCEPEHIYAGTQVDNMADAIKAGHRNYGDKNYRRQHPPQGERHPHTILKDEQVLEIRRILIEEKKKRFPRRLENGVYTRIGQKYGVSGRTIVHIFHRESWTHLP